MSTTSVKQTPCTCDADGNVIATPPPAKIDLRDAHAIRREMASVYRDMRKGTIETQDGTRLCYVLDLIRKAWETGVLAENLEAMERTNNMRKSK
jgi:hypothetical protein